MPEEGPAMSGPSDSTPVRPVILRITRAAPGGDISELPTVIRLVDSDILALSYLRPSTRGRIDNALEKTNKLQLYVEEFVVPRIGREHIVTVRMKQRLQLFESYFKSQDVLYKTKKAMKDLSPMAHRLLLPTLAAHLDKQSHSESE